MSGACSARPGPVLEVRGGRRLAGEVRVGGSKQGALHLLGAALLADGEVSLRSAPDIRDVRDFLTIYASVGVWSTREGDSLRLRVAPSRLDFGRLAADSSARFRSSVLLLGSALVRAGAIRFPEPGGCALGPRPLHRIASVLEAFGYELSRCGGVIAARRMSEPPVLPRVDLGGIGQNATALAFVLAAGRRGRSEIVAPLRSPAIDALVDFLTSLGVTFEATGADGERICVHSPGVGRLVRGDVEAMVGPDGPETAFWIAAAALTKSTIRVRCDGARVAQDNLGPLGRTQANLLEPLGIPVRVVSDCLFEVDATRGPLRAMRIRTHHDESRGVTIDAAPHFIPVLASTNGVSYYEDIHYGPHRVAFAQELTRMGARITRRGSGIQVCGVPRLRAANLRGEDIRGTAALVLSALAADGVSRVRGYEHMTRGYSGMLEKLGTLGARVRLLTRPTVRTGALVQPERRSLQEFSSTPP